MGLYNEIGWRDNVQAFSAAIGTGTTEPNWENIGNGLYCYRFTNAEELFVSFHIDHDVLVGGKTYPHIHWMPTVNMTVGQTLTWELTLAVAKGHHQGERLTATTTTLNLVYTADGTELAGEHMILECTDLQSFITPEVDSAIMMKCKYLTGTYTSPVYGVMADLHYQVDRNATPNKAPNFYN